jgi:predicted transcriptional regulator
LHNARTNRHKVEIVADILEICRNDTRKTSIMYQANLSFKLLTKYLRLLQQANLVRAGEDGYVYSVTDKGLEFLKQYYELRHHSRMANEKRKVVESSLSIPDMENLKLRSGCW